MEMQKQKNPIRTQSGVAPIAVMIPPRKCPHGVCLYCPTLEAPQSYTPESPAVRRAKALEYSPFLQIKRRIEQLEIMRHPTDKIELIIMGGTFLAFPEEFQFNFIKSCFDALNNKVSSKLEEAKKINEKAKHRCVALCIETRPDYCGEKQIGNMLKFGATRVELGVQAIDDKIYKIVNRGHKVEDVINATALLKKYGFKVGYHMMPGLPGSNPKKDFEMFKKIFSSPDFKPDQLKIYPCQVLKGAKLLELYKNKEYTPYSTRQAFDLLLKAFPIIPRYCRVMRIMREIPKDYLIAGVDNAGIRHELEKSLKESNKKIKEVRFREIGHVKRTSDNVDYNLRLKTTKYPASDGTEFFIEIINKDDVLFALIRLRFNKNDSVALVRELHVYGPALPLKMKEKDKQQHQGFGKQLLAEAEKISKKAKKARIKIISGVGVREYYQNLGYNLDKEGYMEKEL